MPGMVDILGQMGRHGDDQMAHVGTGEVVVPNEIIDQNPTLMSAIIKAFVNSGQDWRQFMVGGEEDKRNPQTGAREYFFDEDPAYGGPADFAESQQGIGGGSSGQEDDRPSISRDPSSYQSNPGQRSDITGISGTTDQSHTGYGPGTPGSGQSPGTLQPSPYGQPESDTTGAAYLGGMAPSAAAGLRQGGLPGGKLAGSLLSGGITGAGLRGGAAFAGSLLSPGGVMGNYQEYIGDPYRDRYGDDEPSVHRSTPAPRQAPAPAPGFSRPGAPAIPAYLGLEGMSPQQMRSSLATRAVAGSDPRFRDVEARNLWRTLLQRDLISDTGDLGAYDSILPIEHQYARHLGLDYDPTTEALLTALAGL